MRMVLIYFTRGHLHPVHLHSRRILIAKQVVAAPSLSVFLRCKASSLLTLAVLL